MSAGHRSADLKPTLHASAPPSSHDKDKKLRNSKEKSHNLGDPDITWQEAPKAMKKTLNRFQMQT